MPDLRAGSMAQIQDFSSRSGEKLVDILGKQLPTASILNDLVGKATRAWDSDQIAKAAALQETMMGLGYGPEKIRAALTGAGIRAGIVGSKELQDRYEEGEATRIAKEAHDNTMRINALKEQSSSLLADLNSYVQSFGPNAAYVWLKDHPEYKNNPYAYKAISDYTKANNLDITPLTNTDPVTTESQLVNIIGNQNKDQSKINETYRGLLGKLEQYKAQGLILPTDPKERLSRTNKDAFIKARAEKSGYLNKESGWFEESNSSKFNDLNDNINKAYSILEKEVPNASPELILYVIDKHLESSVLPFKQEDIWDMGKAVDELKALVPLQEAARKDVWRIERILPTLKEAHDNNTRLNAGISAKTLETKLINAIDQGLLTREQADAIESRNTSKTAAELNTIRNAVREGELLLNKK